MGHVLEVEWGENIIVGITCDFIIAMETRIEIKKGKNQISDN